MCPAGGVLQGILFPLNLGRLSNSVALWLNIEPYELFFYVFLPPLLLDAAVKLDFFLFRKVLPQSTKLSSITMYQFGLHTKPQGVARYLICMSQLQCHE